MRHGFLLIDKPAGPTSHDVVGMLRRTLNERHIGHLGTLDPIASGLLVLAVGAKALKTVELFQHSKKEYIADAILGAVSTTYDRAGMLTEQPPKKGWSPPEDGGDIQTAINRNFVGRTMQVPPAYSAVKIGGERAYRKARQGIDVLLPPREVEIFHCVVLMYEYPKLRIQMSCSAGTYVRSLIHDIGTLLRCGAYMQELRRTKVGDWSIENAVTPDRAGWSDVIPLKECVTALPRLDLSADEWAHIRHGRTVPGACEMNTLGWFQELPVALLEFDPTVHGRIKARKVL